MGTTGTQSGDEKDSGQDESIETTIARKAGILSPVDNKWMGLDPESQKVALTSIKSSIFEKKQSYAQFSTICDTLCAVQIDKGNLYGDYVKNRSGSDRMKLAEHFYDIKRKYIRANNFVEDLLSDTPKGFSIDELIDTYADLAVYAILGLQLIDSIRRENKDG